jgi:hypothetical protein
MNLSIFDGQKPIASYLYEKIFSWEFNPETLTLQLTVVKSNSEGNSGTDEVHATANQYSTVLYPMTDRSDAASKFIVCHACRPQCLDSAPLYTKMRNIFFSCLKRGGDPVARAS